jgi:hypothetical protein
MDSPFHIQLYILEGLRCPCTHYDKNDHWIKYAIIVPINVESMKGQKSCVYADHENSILSLFIFIFHFCAIMYEISYKYRIPCRRMRAGKYVVHPAIFVPEPVKFAISSFRLMSNMIQLNDIINIY